MDGTTGDGAFFFKCIQENLDGMCIAYIDDALQPGTENYSAVARKTGEKFKCRKRAYDKFNFFVVQIEKKHSGYRFHRSSYIEKMKKLENAASFKDYRSLRAKLAWMKYVRPDICLSIAKAALITEAQYISDRGAKFGIPTAYSGN